MQVSVMERKLMIMINGRELEVRVPLFDPDILMIDPQQVLGSDV